MGEDKIFTGTWFLVFTPSSPFFDEGLTNEVHDTHDVRDQHDCTGTNNRVWICLVFLLFGFGK